jgi:hypothetical protein
MTFEEVILRDQPLRIQHARIPIGQIAFDPENPRLRYLRGLHPDKTDKQLLFDGSKDTPWLKKDIREKGVLDPIYVKLKGSTGYIVVEGNRRTAVVGELHDENPSDPKFATMPARILPEETTEAQVALLMASFHVAGKVKWAPHEQAGHVYQMLKILHIPEAELSSTLHMGVPAIKRIAESYSILRETYCTIDNGQFANQAEGKWSFFQEMLKNKHLKNYHDRDPNWKEQFSRWVGEGRIPRAEDVRHLPQILNKTRARHLFENEPAVEAFAKARRESDASNPGNISKFYKQLEKLVETCRRANFEDIELAGNNEAARLLLTESYQHLVSFMERAGVRLPAPRRAA